MCKILFVVVLSLMLLVVIVSFNVFLVIVDDMGVDVSFCYV